MFKCSAVHIWAEALLGLRQVKVTHVCMCAACMSCSAFLWAGGHARPCTGNGKQQLSDPEALLDSGVVVTTDAHCMCCGLTLSMHSCQETHCCAADLCMEFAQCSQGIRCICADCRDSLSCVLELHQHAQIPARPAQDASGTLTRPHHYRPLRNHVSCSLFFVKPLMAHQSSSDCCFFAD